MYKTKNTGTGSGMRGTQGMGKYPQNIVPRMSPNIHCCIQMMRSKGRLSKSKVGRLKHWTQFYKFIPLFGVDLTSDKKSTLNGKMLLYVFSSRSQIFRYLTLHALDGQIQYEVI